MQNIPKNLILEIMTKLELVDLSVFCLINNKIHNLCKSEQFWKLKRVRDYPNFKYPEQSILSEKDKYFRIYNTGLVKFWFQDQDFITITEFIFPHTAFALQWTNKIFAYDVIRTQSCVYYLQATGELYVVGSYFSTSGDIKKTSVPILLLKEVADIYEANDDEVDHELYLQMQNGDILYYQKGQFIFLLNAEKIINFFAVDITKVSMGEKVITNEGNKTYFYLTQSNILYIKSGNKYETRLNVLDIDKSGTQLVYLQPKNIITLEDFSINPSYTLDHKTKVSYESLSNIRRVFIDHGIIAFLTENLYYTDLISPPIKVADNISDVSLTLDSYFFTKFYYLKTDGNIVTYSPYKFISKNIKKIPNAIKIGTYYLGKNWAIIRSTN